MNCDWVKENVVLYIYDELADDARHTFEHHTQHCLACRQELESALAFKDNMAALPVPHVSPNFLASSRMKLQEAMEGAEQSHGWRRFFFDFAGWMQQIKLAPALTVALLMIGFAGGSLTTYRIAKSGVSAPAGPDLTQVSEGNIAGIESVVPTDANHVLIKYDTLHSQTAEGAADDPHIQQLLLLATQNNRNTDVRLDSIGVLKSKAQIDIVRDALITSLRYDKNPGVRLVALDALKSYVRDVRVRDVILDALLHDTNAGVRSEAIGLLDQVRADSSVREAFRQLARGDKDKFIRTQSRRYLENTPDMD